jgi:hypothetical protein
VTGPSTPEEDRPVYTQAQLDACVAHARRDGAAEERERIAAEVDRKADLADARSERVQGHLRTAVLSEVQALRWASTVAREAHPRSGTTPAGQA